MKIMSLPLFLLPMMLLLSAACGTSSAGGDAGLDADGAANGGDSMADGADGGGDQQTGCRRDNDCAAPTPRCQLSSGKCVACLVNSDCPMGYNCKASECVPGEFLCKTDEECAPQRCNTASGACVECLEDNHCPAEFLCLNSQCRPREGIPCENEDDCNLGELCLEKFCVPGCRSVRDCPQGYLCDPNRGEHGQCVQCITSEDCPGGLRCSEGFCQFFCQSDADCPGGRCDPRTERCVECLKTDDCPLGNVCYSNSCQPGCASSRDCPQPLLCNPALDQHGRCVQCLKDTDCKATEACRDGVCRFICQSDNDCAIGRCLLSTGQCVDCLDTADCALGKICIENSCVEGCQVHRDCPVPKKCAIDLGPHGTCVECLENADCSAGACVQNRCQASCRNDSECLLGYCLLSSGRCVECLSDDHCVSGLVCAQNFCTPGCRNAAGCAPPRICDLSTSPGRCVDCVRDTDCATGGTCRYGSCVYPGKRCGETCDSSANECAYGLFCSVLFGKCMKRCASDADCPGSSCFIYSGYGMCWACPPAGCQPACPPGSECINSACRRRCFPPCDFAYNCNDGNCEPLNTPCDPECETNQFCWNSGCKELETDGCPPGMIYLPGSRSCIDRFEASLRSGSLGNPDGSGVTATAASVAGTAPIASVTYHQARQVCINSGKRLCQAAEWVAACEGISKNTYPYGKSYVEYACHSNSSASNAARPCGSYLSCISETGAVDMSGNLWEWTNTPYSSANDRKILGGGFGSSPENSTCKSDLNQVNGSALPLTDARPSLGFRCCLSK